MYSEQISQEYKIEEYQLIKLLKNVQCKNCGLIYKKTGLVKKHLILFLIKLFPFTQKGGT